MHNGGLIMKNSKEVIAGFMVILFLIISTIANAAPKAEVDKLVYNVGEIPQGIPIIHDFIVKNNGDKPLEIKVKHCWGVKIKAPVGPIEPGKSGKINVEINSSYQKDSYKKDIEVTTNDPNKSSFKLTVLATIRESLSIDPQYVNFGSVPTKTKLNRPIKITNKNKNNATITLINVNPAVNFSISPNKNIIIKPGKTRDLLLKLDTGKNHGMIEGSVLIKTNLPNLPHKIIPVSVAVTPRW
jgi:hypothetical protein